MTKSVVRLFISVEFSSKNAMLNFSRFSGGMGLRIRSGEVLRGGVDRAISVLNGMWSMTG